MTGNLACLQKNILPDRYVLYIESMTKEQENDKIPLFSSR